MAIQISIPKSVLVEMLETGFITRTDRFERLLEPGHVLTLVISDAEFTVPDQIGAANVIASRQKRYAGGAIVLAEILTRI